VDVADGHDRRATKDAVDQDVEQVPLERDELVDDRKSDCTGGGDQQEEQQASEDVTLSSSRRSGLFMRP
jgi:hypothetical protein